LKDNKISNAAAGSVGQNSAFPDLYPLDSNAGRISSNFGMRWHPVLHRNIHHNGIDIATPTGTKVRATAAGKVVRVQKRNGGYGNNIIVAHSDGYTSLYAHLDEILVVNGQTVEKGQIIAKSGNTGMSTGPHLHFEIRKNEIPLDPLLFIVNKS
jgi:murein DD-endopeptidase MepM/ murein hydrolase activator NlpD